jgi:C-terminal processing protease CtpA/Prc
MKKTILSLFLIIFTYSLFAQDYEIDKLKTISKIWGECYLFHPSIISVDRKINWEKQLVEFLPSIKETSSSKIFLEKINTHLLAALEDPFTIVQSYHNDNNILHENITSSSLFDYVCISEKILSDFESLVYLDSIISDKKSEKPLILDCRISSQLQIDRHTYTPFKYLMSMMIDKEIPLSQSVSREHFGWDEYNDWWHYEQSWKVSQDDKQQTSNGKLLPITEYQQSLQQNVPDFNFQDFSPIKRPIYFIVNKSFLSYYRSDLTALKANRNNTFLIYENSGTVFPDSQGLIKYDLKEFEFVLNTSVYINNSCSSIEYEQEGSQINSDFIEDILKSNNNSLNTDNLFSFQIVPNKYKSIGKELTVEEKILGVIKIWTIVKYFYPYLDDYRVNWDNVLTKYLESVQKTKSDKEYYSLVQEMMVNLKDSHVSTFHPSILDFSKIFVAPIQFKSIGEKVVITAIDSSVNADIHVGDEIVSINNETIDEIIQRETKRVSSSNQQGLLATVFNAGNFIGESGSMIKFGIRNGKSEKLVEVPRTMYIFQFMGFGDNREPSSILKNNIGYLNLAALTNTSELENELIKMGNTKSLILDLRNSYPTADYQRFLQMLCKDKVVTRKSEVPVIRANQTKLWQYEATEINPDSSFTYNKPIAVLIDKTMISRPEDIAINLRAFSNVVFVGEQTQGTDGEMTKIHLPGGGETSFTGQVVKFGNGETFQGKGIIPDIPVQQTIDGIKNNRDEILEKAIEILEEN